MPSIDKLFCLVGVGLNHVPCRKTLGRPKGQSDGERWRCRKAIPCHQRKYLHECKSLKSLKSPKSPKSPPTWIGWWQCRDSVVTVVAADLPIKNKVIFHHHVSLNLVYQRCFTMFRECFFMIWSEQYLESCTLTKPPKWVIFATPWVCHALSERGSTVNCFMDKSI